MKRLIAIIVTISFVLSNFQPVWAQSTEGFNINQLPVPGVMISPSLSFVPVLLKGLVIHPNQPFNFDFIVDSGNDSADKANIQEQSQRMIRYFLTALTIPAGDLWVNLSPYEKDRIITNELGQTDMGRDMLAQDYVLKQLTASLIYPEKDLGKEFWSRVYKKVLAQTGNTNIPVNTFNKVWIVPNGADVFEHGNAVYVTQASLKVMLEEDYLSLKKHNGISSISKSQEEKTHAIGNQVVREIILPEIEKEVNEGQNFALLRQVYYAAILAKWYRTEIQKTILAKVYVDKKKLAGINLKDSAIKEQIYQRYIRAYKKGVFNFIKEDSDNLTGQIVPRKYFSGGAVMNGIIETGVGQGNVRPTGQTFDEHFSVVPEDSDAAMNVDDQWAIDIYSKTLIYRPLYTIGMVNRDKMILEELYLRNGTLKATGKEYGLSAEKTRVIRIQYEKWKRIKMSFLIERLAKDQISAPIQRAKEWLEEAPRGALLTIAKMSLDTKLFPYEIEVLLQSCTEGIREEKGLWYRTRDNIAIDPDKANRISEKLLSTKATAADYVQALNNFYGDKPLKNGRGETVLLKFSATEERKTTLVATAKGKPIRLLFSIAQDQFEQDPTHVIKRIEKALNSLKFFPASRLPNYGAMIWEAYKIALKQKDAAMTTSMPYRSDYVNTVYQIPATGTDRTGQEGKTTLRIFEIFNLNLTPTEQVRVLDQIRNHPNKHIVLLKKEIIERAKNGSVKIVLTPEMGVIPADFIGKEITLGDNSPSVLEEALSDDPAKIPHTSQVRLSPAGLYRIKIDDMYLLSFNKNRLKKGKFSITPIGGAFDFLNEAGKVQYENAGITMQADDPTKPLEMRQTIQGDKVEAFLKLFNQGKGRETSAVRELEELVGQGSEEDVFQEIPQNARLMYHIVGSFANPQAVFDALKNEIEKKTTTFPMASLNRAFDLISQYHTVMRDDGRIYAIHPLEIAYYLVYSLGITDPDTILAALLHDLPEDTDFKLNDVRREFGDGVAAIVQDLTESSQLRAQQGRLAAKVEHLNRVEQNQRTASIVIKVVDRLQNLLTNELPQNVHQRRMEILEIDRWEIFLHNSAVPDALRTEILPFLERERKILLDAAMTGKKIVRNIFYGLGAVTVLLLASGGYVAYKMSQADLSKLPNKPLVVLEWHTEAYGLQARQMRDVLYNFDSLSPSQKDDLRNSLIQLFSSKSFRDVIHGYQNDEYLERKFLNSTSSIPKVVATEDSPKLYAKWELKYDQVSTNLGKALGQDNYIGNVHNIMMYIFGPELYLKHSGQTPQERSMNIVPIEGEPTDHELNLQNRLEQSEQVNFDPESTNSRAKLFSIEDSMAKRVDRTGNALTDVELDQVNTFKKPNVRAWVKADLELWNEFLTIVHQRNVTDSKNLQTLTAEGKQALLFIGSSHVPKIYSLLPHTNRRLVDTTPDSKYVEIDRIWDHADRDEPWSVVLPESDSWGTDYIDFSRFTNSVPLTPTNQAPAIYNGGTNTVPTINTNTVLNVTVNHLGQELNKDGNPVNGGIDLNQINFSRTGQRVNLQFDAAQMSEITRPDFNGFRIIIKSVTQIQNPLSLMGVHVLK